MGERQAEQDTAATLLQYVTYYRLVSSATSSWVASSGTRFRSPNFRTVSRGAMAENCEPPPPHPLYIVRATVHPFRSLTVQHSNVQYSMYCTTYISYCTVFNFNVNVVDCSF